MALEPCLALKTLMSEFGHSYLRAGRKSAYGAHRLCHVGRHSPRNVHGSYCPCHLARILTRQLAYCLGLTQTASGSSDCAVQVWNVHTGKTAAHTFRDHIDETTSVAFSPDGTCVVSGSSDRTIRVWNLNDDFTANPKSNIARLCTPYLIYAGGKTWPIRDDGWIDDQSRWLFGVLPDICRFLPSPRVALIISPFGPWPFGPYGLARSEHSDILFGDCWNDCYVP
ncbi:Vegetative incompatibility protein HET-E-1 [Ceratobasidium theobromae]|uniref:Vegetative incompatibility protein HET-E-1 n=1 Tax=Ceratobasidium theobromae TaxID=1582974 RepID=A0A5N5Q8F1_9AGAM|nr:Vegetative incompatibility protein HET-E-1 [Ceratobasidium theobromae]